MLTISASIRYFIYNRPADMRRGIYSLAGLVKQALNKDPLSGDVFVFISKSGNQIRLLQWDRDGYGMYLKRLEAGTFERPSGDKLQLSANELILILQGVRLESAKYRKRYGRLDNQFSATDYPQ